MASICVHCFNIIYVATRLLVVDFHCRLYPSPENHLSLSLLGLSLFLYDFSSRCTREAPAETYQDILTTFRYDEEVTEKRTNLIMLQ
jgi:hypothetical protein